MSDDQDAARLIESIRAAFADATIGPADARRIAELATTAAVAIRRRRDLAETRRLQQELDSHRGLIRRLSADARRREATYGDALSAARAGLWECRLRDGEVQWSAGVYDMFGISAGRRLRREETLEHYAASSLAALEQVRSRSLAAGDGFRLDAEIATSKGERRWIRISARIEREHGRPIRLFGLKQDVTDEKAAEEEARRLAETDHLTGLAGRRPFEARLADLKGGALLLVDLDGFKRINDTFGHGFGDECLRVAAARLRAACRAADLVARVGGDEFAAIYGSSPGLDAPARAARDIVESFAEPIPASGGALRLGASVGLARCAGAGSAALYAQADAAAYAAKAAGGGAYRVYTSAMPTKIAPFRTAALLKDVAASA